MGAPRTALVCGYALAASLAVSPALAQSLALPVMPPMPLPPMPLPPVPVPLLTFAEAPAPDRPAPPSPSATSRRVDALVLRDAPRSEPEGEALRASRRHAIWYGWQTLALDATAVGVLLLGAAVVTQQPPSLTSEPARSPLSYEGLRTGILGLFVVGPATVHVAHGEAWRGLGCAALRIAAPLAGYALGLFAGQRGLGNADTEAEIGAAAGALGASVFDAAVLGWDRWTAADARTAVLRVGGTF